VTMRSWVQVLEIASYRNEGKDYVHKTQSGRTLPWTLCKEELRARGYLFFMLAHERRGALAAGAAVKVLPCDDEVMGSTPGNCLLQKCRKKLRT
jgi:hypothetical protein